MAISVCILNEGLVSFPIVSQICTVIINKFRCAYIYFFKHHLCNLMHKSGSFLCATLLIPLVLRLPERWRNASATERNIMSRKHALHRRRPRTFITLWKMSLKALSFQRHSAGWNKMLSDILNTRPSLKVIKKGVQALTAKMLPVP